LLPGSGSGYRRKEKVKSAGKPVGVEKMKQLISKNQMERNRIAEAEGNRAKMIERIKTSSDFVSVPDDYEEGKMFCPADDHKGYTIEACLAVVESFDTVEYFISQEGRTAAAWTIYKNYIKPEIGKRIEERINAVMESQHQEKIDAWEKAWGPRKDGQMRTV
jgi:hypothetical protein